MCLLIERLNGNVMHLYSAFLVFRPLKVILHYKPQSPIHTHIHTPMAASYHAVCCQEKCGVQYLAQGLFDLWTERELPIFELVDDLLFLLSH